MISKCLHDGDCDHCPEPDCKATPSQASKFYIREEKACAEKYGRELTKKMSYEKKLKRERERYHDKRERKHI